MVKLSGLTEVTLYGGTANRGRVVRVGETVRRPQRATSAATHAFLKYLAAAGFEGAPRFLGIDDRDREVLSFIPGEAVIPPYPSWAVTDSALCSVAQLLRRYHDVAAGFDPSAYTWPASPPPPFDVGPICHNDLNLDNVVFRDGLAVALIDFDLSSPGSHMWDIAGAGRLWAPLRTQTDCAEFPHDPFRRFRLFLDTYGVPASARQKIVQATIVHHDWIYDIVERGAQQGNPGFADLWQHGGADRAHRTRDWIRDNLGLLAEAVS